MAIYELILDDSNNVKNFVSLNLTDLISLGIEEKALQHFLRDNIEIISDGLMVIDEESSPWAEISRRIDLLCIDKEANLVVIELKRTDGGGHMELQAIRYGGMISTMTFDDVVEVHATFLKSHRSDNIVKQLLESAKRDDALSKLTEEEVGTEEYAKQRILNFLGWEDPDEQPFGQGVQIILASAGFSEELTSAVLWLNEEGIDIRCIKMEPYIKKEDNGDSIFLDIQQIIPLPEAKDFQVRIRRRKEEVERIEHRERERAKKFRFNMIVIDPEVKDGKVELYFRWDNTWKCNFDAASYENNTVYFKDKRIKLSTTRFSLSQIANILWKEMMGGRGNVSGPDSWMYGDKTLNEWRYSGETGFGQ